MNYEEEIPSLPESSKDAVGIRRYEKGRRGENGI